MYKNKLHIILRKKLNKKLAILGIIFLILIINVSAFNISKPNGYVNNNKREDLSITNQNLRTSNGESILFQGTESPLNITDIGNLYEINQEVTVSNNEETNLTYYLDEEHDWNVSRIETSINNIQDTREWVNNSGFINNMTVYGKEVDLHNDDPVGNPFHNYADDLDEDPTNPDNIHSKIYHRGALAIRVHFDTIEFESVWDCVFVWNKYNKLSFCDTGFKYDFYTPWILGDGVNITIGSDSIGVNYYGYYIDRYEFVNSSSDFLDNLDNWGNNTNDDNHNYGFGWTGNNTAMYTALYSKPDRDDNTDYFSAKYTKGNYSEIYQNLTIPRGKVIDAEISFAYYAEYAMESNDNLIYFAINSKKVFTLGLREVVEAGRYQWHQTGQINLDLWLNTSKIFDNPINNQKLNISVGIMSGASVSYTGFQDAYQQVIWFDNVSLSLTTIANSSQEGINLTIKAISNGENIINGNEWGTGSLNFAGMWDTNPIIITFNTTSPHLSFILNTSLYGYHKTVSKVNQLNVQGVTYKILKNGSIHWEFYHNLYMPSQYTEFEFEIIKPSNWQFLNALDPTLQSRSFEGGEIGDQFLKINTTNAIFPGWWKFSAISPNYLNLSNTKMSKNGQWGINVFYSGDTTRIRTRVNYSSEIPPNVDLTTLDLKIYYPNGTIWHQESKEPFLNGTVIFSSLSFTPKDFIGGQYNYTIFWSNGTALGGLKSNFLLIHQSSITLLKPDDAKSDLITNAFLGDIIPLRIQLKDSENNRTISGALVTYNWTTGLEYFTEAALGVYETILDTSELGQNGFYDVFINSTKIGFKKDNITLTINLIAETDLLRLDSSYYVELHDNNTVRYSYSNTTGGGISGAILDVNLNEVYYSITDHFDGNYTVEFDTLYIDNLGVYQIEINFSKSTFESQDAIFQFEIIEQSVNMSIYINSQEIQENSLIEAMFKENISISVRIFAEIDQIYLSEGNLTWNSDNYNKRIYETADAWFNNTIPLSSNNISVGLNFVYIRFEQENFRITDFGFQLLISEQTVNISTYIDGRKIAENSIKELSFKEIIDISASVFTEGEKIYLSGANITFFSDNYNKNLPETTFPWYNSSITISSSYFSSGINYVYLKFQLEDYTTATFSFQLLIKTQTINLTMSINSRQIPENYLLDFDFNDQFSISARSYANTEKIYLTEGVLTFIVNEYEEILSESDDYWYNTTISCSSNIFSLGVNYAYLQFQKENYSTAIFSFQILIDQIDFRVDSIGFEDTINAEIGETINIQLKLLDPNNNATLENASISFTWEYGFGIFNETSPGIYQNFLELPENLKGNYQFNLIVIPENIIYKAAQHSFVIVISEVIRENNSPGILLWSIILVLIGIVSALGILSLRSYVLIPRRRKRESELLSKTQRFKDLNNIQAVVIVHTLSGIPIYAKTYSILEKRKKELFSGFIQAITMVGEEFSQETVQNVEEKEDSAGFGMEKIIELDFKQFHCLIADREEVRIIFILKEKSSERLKSQVSHLMLALNLKLSNELEDWDGSLDTFEKEIPPILNDYFELYYKESFKLPENINFLKLRKEQSLSKMEMRVINVIQSMSKDNIISDLNHIIELVSEENKDLIIEAIEVLIRRGLIVPSSL